MPKTIQVQQALFDVVRRRTLIEVVFPVLGGELRAEVMDMREYWQPQAFAKRMVELGFPLPPDRDEVARLHAALRRDAERAAADPARRVEATPLQGWHGETAFVFGDRVIPLNSNVVFQPAPGIPYPRAARRGTIQGWRAGVGAALPGSSRLVLAACAALATPLLAVWDGPVAGFGFDFSGPSRSGTTSALRVARSTLGPPEPDGWNVTRAGAAQYLLGHRGLPVILDGTTAARPGARDAPSIVRQLTDLVAGGRPDIVHAGATGALERAGVTFQSLLLSSTEGTLRGRPRGHQARLIEVPAPTEGFGVIDNPHLCSPPVSDAASAGRWIEALVRAAEAHHGHAFPRFVFRLTGLGDALGAEVRALADAFRAATPEADADPWARSLRDCFALVHAAGALACRFGVFPFEEAVVEDCLRRCLRDALAHAAAPATALAEADAGAVRAWLGASWAGRLDASRDGLDGASAAGGQILVDTDADGERVCLVRKEALAGLVPEPGRLEAALRLIAARGGLRPGEAEGKLTRQKRLADGTKPRFLFFTEAFARPGAPEA